VPDLHPARRIIDYRPEMREEIASACPQCGAPVTITEERGEVSISGPADRAWAAKYGIEGDGAAETRWLSWACSTESSHYWGPILHG
jgi:hypothetical protein